MGRRWAMLALTVIGVASCSASHAATGDSPSTSVPAPSVGPDAPAQVTQSTLRGAVVALLSAEQRGDHTSSFVLLSDESRVTYSDITRWQSAREEVPAITAFNIVGNGRAVNSLDVLVAHSPGLDPYRGLSPAQEHETWVGRHEHGGWLVDADPAVALVLPADSGVASAAREWLKAAEACDQSALRRMQAVDPLLGVGNASQQFCGQHISFRLSGPLTVLPGEMTQQLVAQYSANATGWARMIRLSGASAPIELLLAPIGGSWQVIGVFA